MKQYKFKENKGDYIISFAVTMQSLLMLVQLTLIDVFHVDHEVATIYRVILTAIPMAIAIIISAKRNIGLWLVSLLLVGVIFLYTVVAFPENQVFLMSQALRFTLPICLPSLLCLCSLWHIEIVEKMLYVISCFCVVVVFFYFFQYFRGAFFINSYDMPFSSACLLPMVILYARKTKLSMIVSLMLFIVVLAIGSRGTALYYLVYVVFDMFQTKSKMRWLPLCIGVVVVLLMPYLPSFFESIGLHSRTLGMLYGGNITYDSERGYIVQQCWNKLIKDSPLFGLGIFGDYVITGNYCHNIFLEILVDFGLIVGSALILFLLSRLIRIYFHSNKEYRKKIIQYFCALILPFMTSNSYLTNSDFWLFVGMCILIHHSNVTQGREFCTKVA